MLWLIKKQYMIYVWTEIWLSQHSYLLVSYYINQDQRKGSFDKPSAEMGEITNVTEYQAIAKEKLPKMAYDYYASGAEDQWTLAENRNAFSRIL